MCLYVHGVRSEIDVSCDFTLLGETEAGNMGNLSHRLKVLTIIHRL